MAECDPLNLSAWLMTWKTCMWPTTLTPVLATGVQIFTWFSDSLDYITVNRILHFMTWTIIRWYSKTRAAFMLYIGWGSSFDFRQLLTGTIWPETPFKTVAGGNPITHFWVSQIFFSLLRPVYSPYLFLLSYILQEHEAHTVSCVR